MLIADLIASFRKRENGQKKPKLSILSQKNFRLLFEPKNIPIFK